MGIYDRDWYKKEAQQRFQSSAGTKSRRESEVRSKFERFTDSFSGVRGSPQARNSTLTNALIWLGLGALCFALFTWISAPKVSIAGDRIEVVVPKAKDGHHYVDGVLNGKVQASSAGKLSTVGAEQDSYPTTA